MKGYRDIAGDGGSNIVEQVVAQHGRLAARMASVRASVAVVSGKGGVGKSSITANLAGALAARGFRVGVLDADLNGPSMGKMLGVRGQTLRVAPDGVQPAVSAEGIRVLSMDLLLSGDDTPVVWEAPTQAEAHTWRGTMEGTALREFLTDTAWGALDLLLIDLPPGSDRLPTLLDLLPGARERGARLLGLIENMAGYVCPTCGAVGPLFDGPGGEATAARHGLPFLGRVPFDPRLAVAADRGRPFVLEHGETPAGRALDAIAGALTSAVLPA